MDRTYGLKLAFHDLDGRSIGCDGEDGTNDSEEFPGEHRMSRRENNSKESSGSLGGRRVDGGRTERVLEFANIIPGGCVILLPSLVGTMYCVRDTGGYLFGCHDSDVARSWAAHTNRAM